LWWAFSAETMGAKVARGKWIRGNGTRLAWNSFKSRFKEPSNRREAVTTWAIRRLRLVKLGEAIPKFFLANGVDSPVIDHERAVGVLEGGVGGQDSVVRLDDGVAEPGGGINAELELGLLSVIGGETLE
jgi:hypothetical protein